MVTESKTRNFAAIFGNSGNEYTSKYEDGGKKGTGTEVQMTLNR